MSNFILQVRKLKCDDKNFPCCYMAVNADTLLKTHLFLECVLAPFDVRLKSSNIFHKGLDFKYLSMRVSYGLHYLYSNSS